MLSWLTKKRTFEAIANPKQVAHEARERDPMIVLVLPFAHGSASLSQGTLLGLIFKSKDCMIRMMCTMRSH